MIERKLFYGEVEIGSDLQTDMKFKPGSCFQFANLYEIAMTEITHPIFRKHTLQQLYGIHAAAISLTDSYAEESGCIVHFPNSNSDFKTHPKGV